MNLLTGAGYYFKHTETKHNFNAVKGAPCEWAKDRGATHTLLLEKGGTRPLKIAKTRAYVGVDESDDGNIVWETWPIKILGENPEGIDQNTIWYFTKLWAGSGFKHLEALANWRPV
jgi:hypothetical protein